MEQNADHLKGGQRKKTGHLPRDIKAPAGRNEGLHLDVAERGKTLAPQFHPRKYISKRQGKKRLSQENQKARGFDVCRRTPRNMLKEAGPPGRTGRAQLRCAPRRGTLGMTEESGVRFLLPRKAPF